MPFILRTISWVKSNREYANDSNKRRHLKKLLAQERTKWMTVALAKLRTQYMQYVYFCVCVFFCRHVRANDFCYYFIVWHCVMSNLVVVFFGRCAQFPWALCFWPKQFIIPDTHTTAGHICAPYHFHTVNSLPKDRRIETNEKLNPYNSQQAAKESAG